MRGRQEGPCSYRSFVALQPLGRVAFCLVLFIKTRDIACVGFTAYVLAVLIIGFLLGHVG
jgi:hypothetical protein